MKGHVLRNGRTRADKGIVYEAKDSHTIFYGLGVPRYEFLKT